MAATSVEPVGRAPYSPDIGWRVVWQRIGLDLSFRHIAARLQIGLGTAYKLYAWFEETGDVAPKKRGSRRDSRKLDEFHETYIICLLAENPSLYLSELCQRIYDSTGTKVSISTVCQLLKRNNILRKKMVYIARQRYLEHRAAYMANILNYPADWLVFLDETGCDNKDGVRKQGYSFVGESPTSSIFLNRGARISAISALSQDGLTCYELINGTTNGETFHDFVRGSLIPEIQPFPAKKSVLIMDNCSIHHVARVKDLLQS